VPGGQWERMGEALRQPPQPLTLSEREWLMSASSHSAANSRSLCELGDKPDEHGPPLLMGQIASAARLLTQRYCTGEGDSKYAAFTLEHLHPYLFSLSEGIHLIVCAISRVGNSWPAVLDERLLKIVPVPIFRAQLQRAFPTAPQDVLSFPLRIIDYRRAQHNPVFARIAWTRPTAPEDVSTRWRTALRRSRPMRPTPLRVGWAAAASRRQFSRATLWVKRSRARPRCGFWWSRRNDRGRRRAISRSTPSDFGRSRATPSNFRRSRATPSNFRRGRATPSNFRRDRATPSNFRRDRATHCTFGRGRATPCIFRALAWVMCRPKGAGAISRGGPALQAHRPATVRRLCIQ
jgi:hypothetical protein